MDLDAIFIQFSGVCDWYWKCVALLLHHSTRWWIGEFVWYVIMLRVLRTLGLYSFVFGTILLYDVQHVVTIVAIDKFWYLSSLISSHLIFLTLTYTLLIIKILNTKLNITAYIISTIFVATPLFMYEMLLGQFLRLHAANAWVYIKPRWQGLAISQFVMLLIGT